MSGGGERPASQHWDPERYARNAGFVAELGMPVVELLDPKPGERILDLGCGDGALTVRLKELGASVIGVDSSPEQIRGDTLTTASDTVSHPNGREATRTTGLKMAAPIHATAGV